MLKSEGSPRGGCRRHTSHKLVNSQGLKQYNRWSLPRQPYTSAVLSTARRCWSCLTWARTSARRSTWANQAEPTNGTTAKDRTHSADVTSPSQNPANIVSSVRGRTEHLNSTDPLEYSAVLLSLRPFGRGDVQEREVLGGLL